MKNFRPWLAGAITVIVLFFVGVIILATTLPGQQTASATKPTATSTSTPGTGTPATSCDPMFEQVAGNNANHSVDADFAAKYAEATKDAANLSDAQKTLLLENSANNAQRLATWAQAFGLYSDPNNWQPLVAEDCLSAEGQKLYYRFEGALNATGTTFAEADAPADGYNSGVDENGVYGVDASQGVRGDRKAIQTTLPDGTTVSIMVRCGNVVHSGPPPGFPTVPTDNPPVETPPVTPPTADCPPGQVRNDNGECVVPKSNNLDDYMKPGDDNTTDSGTGTKPRVPTVTTPPELSPPPVVTSVPGGGGVVDTPTNAPGSETGVTAPGAVPAPTTPAPVTTTEPSVNPGPDNSGENTGVPVNPYG